MSLIILGSVIGAILLGVTFLGAIFMRRVVPTNMVHIVQSVRKTTPYGTGQATGNVYYEFPSWLPILGVNVIKLPVSNFGINLKDYDAYDKDRVPFLVDIVAFFRIADTAKAAQRVTHIGELQAQLTQIIQGAVRKILAGDHIDVIMTERAKFGDQFTKDVADQLQEWGVESVKSMELMDIRDTHNSEVIHNIMAKKISHIAMESRVEVANNTQVAESAEIDAKRTVALSRTDAEQQVGIRNAEKEKVVGIATEKANQDVQAEAKTTTEREMAVQKVQQVTASEIARDVAIVQADAQRKVQITQAEAAKAVQVTNADAQKLAQVTVSEGNLTATLNDSNGVAALGKAKAEAEAAMLLAPVTAQTKLAQEIGANEGYQKYLVDIRQVEANQAIGVASAEALKAADVKIIANAGSATDGLKGAAGIFTPSGGTSLGGMLEALAQTDEGAKLLGAVTAKLNPSGWSTAATSAKAAKKA
jgi:flotillin